MSPKAKRTFFTILILAVVLGTAGFFLVRDNERPGPAGAAKQETLYTCGMHPQVIQNKPGNCPICGMKLTPMRKQGGSASAANAGGERKIKFYKSTMIPGEVSPAPRKDSMGMDMVPVYEGEEDLSATISIDPVTTQNMGIRSGLVTNGPLRRLVRTVGVVDFDETSLADVTTKFKGWIEKLYVDTTGKQVHRGEPLFEIYSPELYSAQTEYLTALSSASGLGAENLRRSAVTKLKFFDISDEQIAELEKTRQPKKTLRVLAPHDGIVVEKMAVEGQMVDAGMRLYRLAGLALVWVQSQIYEQDLAFVSLGQEATVTLSYLADRKFRGRVTYIYPTVDEKTRTARVRMEFHNPGYFLKPGMFATVELESELERSTLLVPDSAVLRSGEKNTVFVVREPGKFEPRTITLGARAENGMYQVLSGLSAGERVVNSGQFMLDSESQLREAIQKMLEPTAAPGSGEHAGHAMETNQPDAHTGHEAQPNVTDKITYICPMPEHISIEYEKPGKCPLCGMTLVPVSKQQLSKIQPGAAVEYFTCPMPEHSDLHMDKPGKCPRCGMTLIPITKPAPVPRPAATVEKASDLPTLYTCPMASHADVVSDEPGKCPKCEMDLVETTKVKHGKIAEQHWKEGHGLHRH